MRCRAAAGRLPQIFEPLYTTKPKGMGLGLYIAQEMVRAHGGQFMVQSTEGQGTTFIITLEVAQDDVHFPSPRPRPRALGW